MVSELCRVVRGEVRENRIGVITPYKAQEKLLKQKLATLSQIEVGTVDSFQVCARMCCKAEMVGCLGVTVEKLNVIH